MNTEKKLDRRGFLAATTTVIVATPLLGLGQTEKKENSNPDEGVTAPEDLMKEHGVLNRCLLIYEEGMRRIHRMEDIDPQVFQHTAQLIRTFVEKYHEKNEEKYIFPVFEKAQKLVDLVKTLKTQHQAGRDVTAQILKLSQPDQFRQQANRDQVAKYCSSFIRMYRPHESREDTVLFPALRTILTPKEVEQLGSRMEEDEQKVLGHEGFEKSVDQVATIEKQLGIFDLKQFTPRV
jgi:hemerythrin-like domain-containing protein